MTLFRVPSNIYLIPRPGLHDEQLCRTLLIPLLPTRRSWGSRLNDVQGEAAIEKNSRRERVPFTRVYQRQGSLLAPKVLQVTERVMNRGTRRGPYEMNTSAPKNIETVLLGLKDSRLGN